MKIEITRGCTSDALIVDGELFFDLSEKKKEKILDYVLAKVKESFVNGGTSFEDIVSLLQESDYKDLGKCDQCFDYIHETIWEI